MAHSEVDSLCPTIPKPLTVLTPNATYRLVRGNVAPGVGTTPSRPRLKSPSSVQAGYFSVASTMLEPDIGALVRAIRGPLAKGPTIVVGGAPSVVAQRVRLAPDAASVVIPVGIWVDDRGRITRVVASEPIFSEVYADGSTESGAQVGTTGSQIPPSPATSSQQVARSPAPLVPIEGRHWCSGMPRHCVL